MPDQAAPVVPLGAQILRKMYGQCKAASTDLASMHGALDECEAKSFIGEHLAGMGASMAGIEKSFAKMYKGIDLEEAAKENPEKKPDEKPTEKPASAEPEPQIKSDDPDEDDDDGMDPQEKMLVVNRIKQLESKIRHEERLRRVAAAKR